jgi:hypothetical protein
VNRPAALNDSNMGNFFSQLRADFEVVSVSLGMVVIDEIRLPSSPPFVDVAGGSGCYGVNHH